MSFQLLDQAVFAPQTKITIDTEIRLFTDVNNPDGQATLSSFILITAVEHGK